jgi:hypothetical protein
MNKKIKEVTSQDGTKAVMKQHDRHTFSLTITSRNIGRNRWGTMEEIEQDIEYFKVQNTLPMSKKGRW